MPPYEDPARRGRVATVALAAYLLAQTVEGIAATWAPEGDVARIAEALLLLTMIAAFVTVCLWVYRVNANAQSFANGLSITPGWNVGWFFVPVANLWRPFEGIRETWQASKNAEDWPAVPVPALLRLWWGCWVAGSIVSNLGLRVQQAASEQPIARALDLLSSALLIAAAALLMRIVAGLNRRQRDMHTAETFA